MSSWISTGMSSALSSPQARAVSVSAMIWPLVRGSPVAVAALAASVSVLRTATPSFTGRVARRIDMPSTAGRRETRRSATARWWRRTAASGSSSCARARARSPARRAVTVGSRSARSASTRSLSSSSRTSTLAATVCAACSLISPASSSAVVRGRVSSISRCRATSSEACLGLMRRASATWSAMPRPRWPRGTSRRSCSRICAVQKAASARACAAARRPLARSVAAIRSIRAASLAAASSSADGARSRSADSCWAQSCAVFVMTHLRPSSQVTAALVASCRGPSSLGAAGGGRQRRPQDVERRGLGRNRRDDGA